MFGSQQGLVEAKKFRKPAVKDSMVERRKGALEVFPHNSCAGRISRI